MALGFTLSNAAGVAAPKTQFSHTARIAAGAERLIISGQVGQTLDGHIPDSAEGQARQVFANLAACLSTHGLSLANVVRLGVFITDAAHLPAVRAVRDEVLAGHKPTSTLLIISGLAHPKYVVEIEAEAVFPQ